MGRFPISKREFVEWLLESPPTIRFIEHDARMCPLARCLKAKMPKQRDILVTRRYIRVGESKIVSPLWAREFVERFDTNYRIEDTVRMKGQSNREKALSIIQDIAPRRSHERPD